MTLVHAVPRPLPHFIAHDLPTPFVTFLNACSPGKHNVAFNHSCEYAPIQPIPAKESNLARRVLQVGNRTTAQGNGNTRNLVCTL